jgi:hypothetical protein
MMTGKKAILPILHCVTHSDVFAYSPTLAGMSALETKHENGSIERIAKKLVEEIKGCEYVKKILAERMNYGLSEEKLDANSLSKYLLKLLKEGKRDLLTRSVMKITKPR